MQKSMQANAPQEIENIDINKPADGRRATDNSTYPKGGVLCFADTFLQAESSVLRMKFCGKSPALRVAANRYQQAYQVLW